MPIQSLGIFDSVFDWVCDKLFDPIINWLSNILNSIFQWIIDQIIIPLVKPVFEFVWNIIIANISDIFYTMIYNGYCEFLWFFDQLQSGFDVLIGLQDVTYVDSNGVKTQSTMLEYFINNEVVRNAVISITFVALALSMIFAIYSVIRSTLDFDFEGRRPVGKVLNSVAKTMIAFLLVPFIAVVGIQLASIVLKQTCNAIVGGSNASLGRWVLAISSMDAGLGNPPASFTGADGQIAEPWASLIAGDIDYVAFATKIHSSRVDYLLGFASIIFMGLVLTICLFTFIKRLFDIVILYITSPYFVSTIVLDDGEKFRRWRETFIAKLLVGYGSVIGLRIFLMMVPAIMSDDLKIFDSVAGNITGGYVIRLIFILGGMFAVYKSSTLLTGIINSGVAANENASNAMLSGMVMGGAIKGAKTIAGAGMQAFSDLRKKKLEKSDTKGNKFSDDMGKVNMPSQAKFSSAYAAAMTGKHREIDTSDYAPLMGKNNYLKDGVKAPTIRQHYEADQDELMADVRDLFGDDQKDAASRSFGDAYNAALGNNDEINTSDYAPDSGRTVYYNDAMEADQAQKEFVASHKNDAAGRNSGYVAENKKKARNSATAAARSGRKNNAASKKKGDASSKKFTDPLAPNTKGKFIDPLAPKTDKKSVNPLAPKTENRSAEKSSSADKKISQPEVSNAASRPGNTAAAGKSSAQNSDRPSAFTDSEIPENRSMNTGAVSEHTSDTASSGTGNTAAVNTSAQRPEVSSAFTEPEISESHAMSTGAAAKNTVRDISAGAGAAPESPSESGASEVRIGESTSAADIAARHSSGNYNVSDTGVNHSSTNDNSASSGSAAFSGTQSSTSANAGSAADDSSQQSSSGWRKPRYIRTVDPLKFYKKNDHKNDSGKF